MEPFQHRRSILLRNATAVLLDPASIERVDIRIHDGVISAKGTKLTAAPGEEVLDLNGKILMPGNINAHTHLYSTLARGMAGPRKPPKTFSEILQKVWWKLDRALDEEAIYYSALVGCLEAVKYGTTTLFDHHASPNAIPASLDIIEQAMKETGIRGVLCYEVSDRDGLQKRDQGLAENERFLAAHSDDPCYRGLMGAHASFTLSDNALALCSEIASHHDTGIHIHVAEAVDDEKSTRKLFKKGVSQRLLAHNIARKNSIFAHAVHLTPREYARIGKTGTWFAHNPRSNMNNRVGRAPIHMFGPCAALGTDGFPSDMFDEASLGFFRQNEGAPRLDAALPAKFLTNGQRLASAIFGTQFGSLKKDSVADLIVLNYLPPTPMSSENLLGHFLFGMKSAMVEHVMVAGKWAVRDRKSVRVDEEEIYARAATVARRLWDRAKISI
jgi:putative selenium metabolism protein SsnA